MRTAITVLLAEGHLLVEDVPGRRQDAARQDPGPVDRLHGATRAVHPRPAAQRHHRCVACSTRTCATSSSVPARSSPTSWSATRSTARRPRRRARCWSRWRRRQVTVDGKTYTLPKPFMVMATQNPIEMEGTYPLPEAQRDRFMARISMGYPSARSELDMLELHGGVSPLEDLQPVTDAATVSLDGPGGPRGARLAGGAAVHRRPHPRHPFEHRTAARAPRRAPRCTCCAPRGPTPRWPGGTTCSPTTCNRSPFRCSRTG